MIWLQSRPISFLSKKDNFSKPLHPELVTLPNLKAEISRHHTVICLSRVLLQGLAMSNLTTEKFVCKQRPYKPRHEAASHFNVTTATCDLRVPPRNTQQPSCVILSFIPFDMLSVIIHSNITQNNSQQYNPIQPTTI